MSERGKNKLPAVQNLHGGRVSASACFIRRHIFVRQSQWIPHRVGIYKIKIVAPVLLIPHFDIIKNIPGHSLAIGKNAEPVRLPGDISSRRICESRCRKDTCAARRGEDLHRSVRRCGRRKASRRAASHPLSSRPPQATCRCRF